MRSALQQQEAGTPSSSRTRDQQATSLELAARERYSLELQLLARNRTILEQATSIVGRVIQEHMTVKRVTIRHDGSFCVQLRTVLPSAISASEAPDLYALQVRVRQHLAQDQRLTQLYVSITRYEGHAMEFLDRRRVCFACAFPFAIAIHLVERPVYSQQIRVKVLCTGKFTSIAN